MGVTQRVFFVVVYFNFKVRFMCALGRPGAEDFRSIGFKSGVSKGIKGRLRTTNSQGRLRI